MFRRLEKGLQVNLGKAGLHAAEGPLNGIVVHPGLPLRRLAFYDNRLMPDADPIPHDIRLKRLLFRATHRGTFENDIMIGDFVRAYMDELTASDLDALEAVMEIRDDDLADWLTGRAPIPPEQETPMLLRMRAHIAR